MTITAPIFHLSSIGPWITLTLAAILILLVDAFSSKGSKGIFPVIALAALAVAAWQTHCLWGHRAPIFPAWCTSTTLPSTFT